MSSFKDRLKQARLPEDVVPVCLRGDLVADFESAERALKEAKGSDSMEDERPVLQDRLEALRAEMLDNTEDFRLRAVPRPAFRALVAAHPPRRDGDEVNKADAQLGVNVDTFFAELLKVSVVSPELDEEDWAALLDKLTDRQYGDLTDAAWFLNRGEVNVPKLPSALLMNRTSDTD